MEPLFLTLFGDVKLTTGLSVEIPLPRKTQILLAYLALNVDKNFPRDKLAGLIWSDRSEKQARQSLRQCLFTLTKSIGDKTISLINADQIYVSLNPEFVEVDIWQFESMLANQTPTSMQQAVVLYVDDFAASVHFDDEALDNWCAAERTRLRERCFETLVKLSSHYAGAARLDEAIKSSRRLVTLDPLREDGHRTLIRLYNSAGRRAEAVKQYRHCVNILRAELNVEPEVATRDLYLEIKGRSDELGADTKVADNGSEPGLSASETPLHSPTVNWRQIVMIAGWFLFIALAAAVFWLSIGH